MTAPPAGRDISGDPAAIRALLHSARTIAVVGLSDNPARPSYGVAQALQHYGYRVVPVNPSLQQALGEQAYGSLAAVPFPVDIVDIFRRPEYVPRVVEEAIAIGAPAVWMQLGVSHPAAMRRALEAGLTLVAERCIKVERARLVQR